MYSELANSFTKTLSDYKPFPDYSDRAFYDALPEKELLKWIEKAEGYIGYEFKAIPISVYMEYSKTGNRSNFERMNFEKRYAINALAMGELAEGKGRFLPDILNGLFSICEETAWQLPAHNSYYRDKPALPVPDETDPVIDLFAAESGALIATFMYTFGSAFDNISPAINKMLRDKLDKRIYKPYINRHFWWMGSGDEPMCNWTVWCTQNILLSVFLNPFTDEALRRSVFEKACYSVDCFLKDYGEDGCCDEGAHYYRHSALCLFNCTEVLSGITDGHFESVYGINKIKNIAEYIFKVHVTGNYYFNFADCSAVIDGAGAQEFLFAKAIGNEEMMRFAALDYKHAASNKNEEELNLYILIFEMLSAYERASFNTDKPVVHSDFYYESVGLFLARDEHFALAVKGGDNGDNHNHNDTGSLIVFKDGLPVLIDVGVEAYTKKTFSSERYDIWTMQSAYHNLPTINDVMQRDGEKYGATEVEYFLNDRVSDIKMNIAGAYPAEAKVKSYRRHVSLYKNKQIVIEDSVEFSKGDIFENSYFLSFMTYEEPVINGKVISVGNCKLQLLEDAMVSYEKIPITDSRLQWAWKHDIYRITIVPGSERVMIVVG